VSDYEYPYRPPGRRFRYVPGSDPIIRLAIRYARRFSRDPSMPNASVIVVGGKPVAAGANGSDYHRLHGCRRRSGGSETGQDYRLCAGCHPRNHSERRAVLHARERQVDIHGADLYLWGHFGCCEDCWRVLLAAGIRDVYLVEDAERLFNKRHPDNVIGSQFEHFGLRPRDPGTG